MKKSPVMLMKEKLQYLPERDIKFAEDFINNRNFEALQDLVNSDILLVGKNQLSATPNPRYVGIDLLKLSELKEIVDEYCKLLYSDLEDDSQYEEEEDIIENTEW